MRLSLALVLFTALRACTPLPPPDPTPPPAPVTDASDDVLRAPCESSCEAYRAFGCTEGEPTKKGTSCEEVCRNALTQNIDIAGSVGCTRAARNCQEVRDCAK